MERNIRPFKPDDAEFCFRVRSSAFIQKFYGELTPQEVTAAVNAYLPNDYIRMSMSGNMAFFIIEENGSSIGFFALKRVNSSTVELPLLYIHLDNLGRGIGRYCVDYMEQWLLNNWKIDTLIVDTVIPKYNSGFYKKAGFKPSEEAICEFLGKKLSALRLVKKLQRNKIRQTIDINPNSF
jgi:N-acetylglutamate synthase-like GNAT family acetyltransferase